MQEYASKVQLHKYSGASASASPSASANVSASDSSDSSAGGDSGHPLLDFVVAADVFMYLGDLTVPPNLSPIHPLSPTTSPHLNAIDVYPSSLTYTTLT